MKIRIITLVLSIVFLASCSSSRYGRIPKGKKQKHVVAKKQFRKKKAYSAQELLQAKDLQEITAVNAEKEINIKEVEPLTPQQAREIVAQQNTQNVKVEKNQLRQTIKEILKPNSTKKQEAQNQTNEIQKGTWLWYIVVGLVLFIVAVILPGLIGALFYIASLIAILIGLLMLLGIL